MNLEFPVTTMVAGVSYNQELVQYLTYKSRIRLIRDHDNQYDENAIKVVFGKKRHHIGYLPRDLAEEIAPLFDAGLIQEEAEFKGKFTSMEVKNANTGVKIGIHMKEE